MKLTIDVALIAHCERNIKFYNENSLRHKEHKRFLELLKKETPMDPDEKLVDCYMKDLDEVYRIKKKVCPICGHDVADHGSGPVCTNPSCRQAIKRGY